MVIRPTTPPGKLVPIFTPGKLVPIFFGGRDLSVANDRDVWVWMCVRVFVFYVYNRGCRARSIRELVGLLVLPCCLLLAEREMDSENHPFHRVFLSCPVLSCCLSYLRLDRLKWLRGCMCVTYALMRCGRAMIERTLRLSIDTKGRPVLSASPPRFSAPKAINAFGWSRERLFLFPFLWTDKQRRASCLPAPVRGHRRFVVAVAMPPTPGLFSLVGRRRFKRFDSIRFDSIRFA